MPRRGVSRVGWLLVLAMSVRAWGAEPLPQVSLSVAGAKVVAELAATERDREVGLMRRPHLGADQGMLFVFAGAGKPCMWMKNTLVPLSVAFIDEAGRIVNIEDMAPGTENAHCALRSARFALELNQGWFARHKVAAGAQVSGLAGLEPR